MPARLVTIPISHFCEKARWALDRAGVDYVERPHLQLIHVLAARFAGGGATVPVFVTDGGHVLAESADILRWADTRVGPERRLYPDGRLGVEVAQLEASLDDGFGPDGRLWMYHETLPVVHQLGQWALAGIPQWERLVFRASGPLVGIAVSRYLGVGMASAAAALDRVEHVFDDIATRLSDGRRFLLGERFTAADLTFAALSAPMLLPAGYGSPLPPPEAMPDGLAREVHRFRSHPAGVFADRLYREERVRPNTVPAPRADERIRMGFGDKFKDLAKQAQDAVAEHKDQISDAVDRASVVADQRTHGKYTNKIAKVGQQAERVVEKLGSTGQEAGRNGDQDVGAGSDHGAAGESPASGPETAH